MRTIEYFDGGTRPYSRVIEEVDSQGLVVKVTPYGSFERGRLSREEPFEIEYDKIDDVGNWTQRTFYRFYGGLDGRGTRFAEYVEYRTISYY